MKRRYTAPEGCEYGCCRADAERGSPFCAYHHPINRIVMRNKALWTALNGSSSDADRKAALEVAFGRELRS
jgi:hypothetical protein